MIMQRALQITGLIFILAGIVFGLSQFTNLLDQYDDVKYWEEAADEHFDNRLIEDRYLMLKDNFRTNLTLTIGSTIFGIVMGIFFISLATIIDLLQKLLVTSKEVRKND